MEEYEEIKDSTSGDITSSGNTSSSADNHEENVILNSIYDKPLSMWKYGTTLITGDSMLNGMDESRLKNEKVRIYPGASVDDMFFNISFTKKKTKEY